MSENESKQLLRRYYGDVLTQGRIDVLDSIAKADYVEHNPFPGHGQGLEGLRQRVNMLRAAFDAQFTLEQMIAEGDKVAVLWTNRGVHKGDFLGIPASGKHFTIQGIDVHHIRDRRMSAHWDVVDTYSLLIQLGVLPAPTGAPA